MILVASIVFEGFLQRNMFNCQGTKHCCWGLCNSDSRYPDRLPEGTFFIPFPKPGRMRDNMTQLEREAAKQKTDKATRWQYLCGRADFQLVEQIKGSTYICSLHFVGGKGPTSEDDEPMLATERSWKPHGWRPKAPVDHTPSPPKRGRKRLLADLRYGEGSSLQDPAAPLSDDESAYDSTSSSESCHLSAARDADSQDWIPTINIGRQSERPQSKASHKKVSDSMCQTELTMEDLRRLEDTVTGLDYDIRRLRQEIVDAEFNPEAFQDNEKTRFYTGLPNYSALVQIFHLCEPCMTAPTSMALSKFQQFIMVFMRLRLNLQAQDLAYRFKVSAATVSQIWVELINILHARLGSLVEWPERDVLQSAMPVSFRTAFGDTVAVIVDCFEVFIKKPTNISARAQTHSNCKDRHSTVKFLIGIAPHGEITYISRAWGGMASNKQIAEECGFLNNMSPGDVVLADRGFDVEEGVGLFCASLHTKGKRRLSTYDSEQARKLSSVRVHVERVTGLVQKKYHILQSLPIGHTDVELNDSMALIDKIAVICCALSNLFKSIVPLE